MQTGSVGGQGSTGGGDMPGVGRQMHDMEQIANKGNMPPINNGTIDGKFQ